MLFFKRKKTLKRQQLPQQQIKADYAVLLTNALRCSDNMISFIPNRHDSYEYKHMLLNYSWWIPANKKVLPELVDEKAAMMNSFPQMSIEVPNVPGELVDASILNELVREAGGEKLDHLLNQRFNTLRTIQWGFRDFVDRGEIINVLKFALDSLVCPILETVTSMDLAVRIKEDNVICVYVKKQKEWMTLAVIVCESPCYGITLGVELSWQGVGTKTKGGLSISRTRHAQYNAAFAMEKAAKVGVSEQSYLHGVYDGSGLIIGELVERQYDSLQNPNVQLRYRGIGLDDTPKLLPAFENDEWVTENEQVLPRVLYKRGWSCYNNESQNIVHSLCCLLTNEIAKLRNKFDEKLLRSTPAGLIISECPIPGASVDSDNNSSFEGKTRECDYINEIVKRNGLVFRLLYPFMQKNMRPTFVPTQTYHQRTYSVDDMSYHSSIGKFKILKTIKVHNPRLASATIHLVQHDNSVAVLKIRDERDYDHFVDELDAFKKLYPDSEDSMIHVPFVFDYGVIENCGYYILMEYISGVQADFNNKQHFKVAVQALEWMKNNKGVCHDFDASLEKNCRISNIDGRCVILGGHYDLHMLSNREITFEIDKFDFER